MGLRIYDHQRAVKWYLNVLFGDCLESWLPAQLNDQLKTNPFILDKKNFVHLHALNYHLSQDPEFSRHLKNSSGATIPFFGYIDVGDQMSWWQVLDVGDKSRHQHQEFGTNIKNRPPT